MVCCLWQSLAERIFGSMILKNLERGPRRSSSVNAPANTSYNSISIPRRPLMAGWLAEDTASIASCVAIDDGGYRKEKP